MLLKRFSFRLTFRVVLLLGTLCLFAYIFGDNRLVFNHFILGAIITIQVAELIRFVHKTNRELSKLFFAIKHHDFSLSFKQPQDDKSFIELQDSLSEIIKTYKEVKIEKEAQFHFLKMLVQQINIGIISIENDTNIILINPAAEKYFHLEGVKNWKIAAQKNPALINEISGMGDQGRKLIQVTRDEDSRFLAVEVNTSLIGNKKTKLITCQDIDSEVEQREIEAWQKLIRILTHEIMNSITPISSLTETIQSMLHTQEGREKEPHELTTETIQDVTFSLKTIHNRSNRLFDFVDTYRQYTRIPKPNLEKISLSELFDSIEQLMQQELSTHKISFAKDISARTTYAHLDRTLMEQVLINLITNSIHALENRSNPAIQLNCFYQQTDLIIEVTDNGKGISEKDLSSIFIPFFSTKNTGSGIGLSLCKQIISLHNGKLKVKSTEHIGTTFYLQFRNQKPF